MRTGNENTLHDSVRRHAPGTTNLDSDIKKAGINFFRREFIGGGPTWSARGCPQACLDRTIINLDDNPIDLMFQRVSLSAQFSDTLLNRLATTQELSVRRDRHPPIFQALKPPRQGIGFCKPAIPGFDKTNAVRQHCKRPFGSFLRVFLTQRTRSCIASVHKGCLTHTDALSVKRFKILRREVDLATNFNAGGNHAFQTVRNTRNCPDVGGDIFANPPVTSRRCAIEYAIFIEQIDCKTVNLDLGEHVQIAATRIISHSGFPACELFQRKNIIQAGHLLEVFNRSKGF